MWPKKKVTQTPVAPSDVPEAGGWYAVDGVGHLFLDPGPHAVCRRADPNIELPRMTHGDAVCPECDRYLHEEYLPHIG